MSAITPHKALVDLETKFWQSILTVEFTVLGIPGGGQARVRGDDDDEEVSR